MICILTIFLKATGSPKKRKKFSEFKIENRPQDFYFLI